MGTDTRIQCDVADIAVRRLDPVAALEFVSDDAFGGITQFIGRVRTSSHGREVLGIDYDLFAPLALAVFERAALDAAAQYGPAIKVHVSHACGALRTGDIAVVVAVGTPHRDEAFRACRDVIEAVKHQAPIWKREHFVDGSTAWSEGCSLCGKEPETLASRATALRPDHPDAPVRVTV